MNKEYKIINSIEEIRKTNNTLWMNILRIAFKHSPSESKQIFKKIAKNDKKINELSEELCK